MAGFLVWSRFAILAYFFFVPQVEYWDTARMPCHTCALCQITCHIICQRQICELLQTNILLFKFTMLAWCMFEYISFWWKKYTVSGKIKELSLVKNNQRTAFQYQLFSCELNKVLKNNHKTKFKLYLKTVSSIVLDMNDASVLLLK